MQRKELNVENFIDLFNSIDPNSVGTPYTTSYAIEFFKKMLDYFYTEYEEIQLEKEIPTFGGVVEIKDGCGFTEYFEIKKILFYSFYPSIIKKLLETNQIKFNVKELGLMYSFVIDNYGSIRKNNITTKDGSTNCKIFLNIMYMVSCNKFNNWGVDKSYLIVDYGRNIMNNIIKNFNDEYIYIDTDMIISKSTERLLDYLNDLDLKYEISDINFMFFNKKKYVIEEDGIFELKGIRINSPRTRRNTNDDILKVIEDFRMNLLYQSRINKVRNIMNKINSENV